MSDEYYHLFIDDTVDMSEDAILNKDGGEPDMAPADELENWEQTVDEILEDENMTGKLSCLLVCAK